MPAFVMSAPGKTILFGEHAVVYGYPAIALPLEAISTKLRVAPLPASHDVEIVNAARNEHFLLKNLNSDHFYKVAVSEILTALRIESLPPMRIEISSTIPIASGLGSSAAFAVCLTRAISGFLGFNLPKEKINGIAYAIETYHHGNPSGIDNTVVTYNKPVYFKKGLPPSFVDLIKDLTLVIADTGIKASTQISIENVKILRNNYPDMIETIFKEIGIITDKAKNALGKGEFLTLGSLMNENHSLLQNLEVSCPALDLLVNTALASGALGAKLCGSGNGGNIVALVIDERSETLKRDLIEKGAAACFITRIAGSAKG